MEFCPHLYVLVCGRTVSALGSSTIQSVQPPKFNQIRPQEDGNNGKEKKKEVMINSWVTGQRRLAAVVI
jgi:hypothetical protein